jgi:VWFA-related protein
MVLLSLILVSGTIARSQAPAHSAQPDTGQASSAQAATPPQKSASNPPQQPRAARTKENPGVVRVTTHLVQVSVVVHDSHGNPVTGLSREDFILTDQGKLQTIELFDSEASQPQAASPAAAQPTLPPNTFTNRAGPGAGVPTSVTVLLFDQLNTSFKDQAYSREQIGQFLRQIRPEDRVALYALSSGLRILQDFTNNQTSLLRAFARSRNWEPNTLKASHPMQLDSNGNGRIDETIPATTTGALVSADGAALPDASAAARDANFTYRNREQEAFFTTGRVLDTVDALQAIARHLAAIPGRKNLVWVSSSFPFSLGFADKPKLGGSTFDEKENFQDFLYSREIERATRAMNDANVAVYPVDARGLIGPDLGIENAPGSSLMRVPSAPTQINLSPDWSPFATMEEIADQTGGRAYFNTNNIQGAIRRAIDDSRVTYLLGFYPPADRWDSKFHKLKVEVKRPGMQVRGRRGYFASLDPTRDFAERQDSLRQAAMSPLDATVIPVTAHVEALGGGSPRPMVVKLSFDAHDVRFDKQLDGREQATLDFLVVQRDSRGSIVGNSGNSANLLLEPELYAKTMLEGITYSRPIYVYSTAAELRILLYDVNTGALGSVSVPVREISSKKTTD